MEIFTLTRGFVPRYLISEFTSAIWTERYFAAGDVQLVVPAVPSMIQRLVPGTFLGLRGTKEIMIVETQSIEDNSLTVTGASLPKFLDEREAWFQSPTAEEPWVSQYTAHTTAGQHIALALLGMVIDPAPFAADWPTNVNLDWTRDKIPNLVLGRIDANGEPKDLTLDLGPLYTSIQKLAQEEGLGIKLYLESANTDGYQLIFASYRGKNRTSEQTVHSLVRLTPKMDSLSGIKEVSSLSSYKNVVYVNYKNEISVHYLPYVGIPTGFNRRVLRVDAPDLYFVDDRIPAFREQVALNAFANHIYIRAVDGRVSSKIPYVYGKDYGLGDVIELEGFTGFFSKARITEYIRAQDQYGERDYPTLAVIDPLETGYMPDLEPDAGFDPDWDDSDPDYDMDPTTDPDFDPDNHAPDPPNHNPDPDPVFPDDDGGTDPDPDGGYDETGTLGACLSLHAHNTAADGECLRWYSHGGRVYLEGTVYYGATGDPDGNITINGALPVAARPASDTSVTIYPDSTNSDVLYGEFTTFSGTVKADGTIVLDDAPWTSFDGFELYLMMGNISWLKGSLVADIVAKELLNPWLVQDLPFGDPSGVQPAATSVGAKIGVHGMRTHLSGKADLVEPVYGNLMQLLPPKYRPARYDRVPILGGGSDHWYPSVVDPAGTVTLTNQRSKPIMRGKNLTDFAIGGWGTETPDLTLMPLSFTDQPVDARLGEIAEAIPVYIKGRWARPTSLAAGTDFGFILSYGFGGEGRIFYKIAAEKMAEDAFPPEVAGQWWLTATIFRSSIEGDVNRHIGMVRVDNDSSFGDLPNGLVMYCSIEEVGIVEGFELLKISTIFGGVRYSITWPQDPETEAGWTWPSDVGATNMWGACWTEAGVGPSSVLTDITADYFIPSGLDFTPPEWLPNGGLPTEGARFDLDNLGWRVPWESES